MIKEIAVPFVLFLSVFFMASCDKEESLTKEENSTNDIVEPNNENEAVFLIIDEESIDNGNEPNNFSETDVNDQLANVGQRKVLDYFQKNIGKTIDLFTGQVGDEGWYAKRAIPSTWISAGPTQNGARNFLQAGPGLGSGSGSSDDNKEVLLDKIAQVTPLRATALTMLKGKTVLAVVYDGDISVNYSPLNGNLMGENLGIVAFDVIKVTERKDGSTSSLPRVTVRIRNADEIVQRNLALFANAPVPSSSSEPFDIAPPGTVQAIQTSPAQ
jgi:hypothetical protein